jgi:hypothetical protein
MFLCSVIVFIEDTPVGYDVHKETGYFVFRRATDSQHEQAPPYINAYKEGSEWIVADRLTENVKSQLLHIIELQDVIDLQNDLSAAS